MSSRFSSFASALREPGVDAAIALEIAALESREVDAKVQERPQAVVAEAVVVAVELVLREVERRHRQAVDLLRMQARAARRGRAPAPAEPQPAVLAQGIDQPHRESARGGGPAHGPDAVRHDDEARRLQANASQPRERRIAAFTMPTSE